MLKTTQEIHSVRLGIINHTYASENIVSKPYIGREEKSKELYNLKTEKNRNEEGNGIRAIRRNITFHYLNPKISEIKCFVCLIHGCVFPMYFIELCHIIELSKVR